MRLEMVNRERENSAPSHEVATAARGTSSWLWAAFSLLSFMPGCRCTSTKVTYGDEVDSATENELAVLLKGGVRRCVRDGESDTCVSIDDFFDEHEKVKGFRLTLGRGSCRVGEQAQMEIIAGFADYTFSVVVGTFSQDWTGAWELDLVEFVGLFPSKLRICEPFGEGARHDDVTVIFGEGDEKEAQGE